MSRGWIRLLSCSCSECRTVSPDVEGHVTNSPFSSLYEDAWGRVRDRSSIVNDSFGVGREEARHCHRRAYEIPVRIDLQDATL